MLEDLLAQDMARKAKHQKAERQQQWRAEITALMQQLAL